eukprot:COSAG03_NODE_3257_length_2121_cov_1.249753_4_plen_92_part_01
MCCAVATKVSAKPSGARNSAELIELEPSGSNMPHTASTTWRISSTLCRSLDSRKVLINARTTSPYDAPSVGSIEVPESEPATRITAVCRAST